MKVMKKNFVRPEVQTTEFEAVAYLDSLSSGNATGDATDASQKWFEQLVKAAHDLVDAFFGWFGSLLRP